MESITQKIEPLSCTGSVEFVELSPNPFAAADRLLSCPNLVVAFPTPSFQWWTPNCSKSEVFETLGPAYQAGRLLGEILSRRGFPEPIIASVISSTRAFQSIGASRQCLLQFAVIKADSKQVTDDNIFSLHRDYDVSNPDWMITRLVQVVTGAPTVWCKKEAGQLTLFTLSTPHAVIFNSSFRRGPLHASPLFEPYRAILIGTLFPRSLN